MNFQATSVATRLVTGVVVVNLFVYAMVAVALNESRSRYLRDSEVARMNVARSLASNFSSTLDRIDVALSNVALQVEQGLTAGSIYDTSLDTQLAAQKRMVRDLDSLWVVDSDGNARWSSEPPSGIALNVARRAYFQHAQADSSKAIFISEPLTGLRTGEWQVFFAKRISRPDGSFAGVVLGSLRNANYFSRLFSGIELGETAMITVRRDDMTQYARYADKSIDLRRTGLKEDATAAADAMRAKPESGSFVAANPRDGIERIRVYQRVDRYPFYVFVGQVPGEILAPWHREVATTLALLFIFTLASVLYSRSSYRQAKATRDAEEVDARAVRRERSRLQAILDSSPVAIVFSANGVLQFTNPRLVEVFGVKVGDPAGTLYVDAADRKSAQEALEAGRVFTGELKMYDRERNVRDMLVTYVPMSFDGQAGVLGWVLDISERKKHEETIRHVSFLNDTALALSHAGYWHAPLDGSGSFTASPRAAEIFGFIAAADQPRRIGEEWLDNIRAIDPACAEEMRRGFLDATEGRAGSHDAIFPFRRPADGRAVWIHSYATVARDATPPVMYGVAQDVTEYSLAQQELAKAKDAAMAATHAKSEFLANISHEIRTPLNAIIGLAHIIQRDGVGPAQAHRLEMIERSGEHLLALVSDVLDLSKIEAGRLDLDSTGFRLGALIGEVESMMLSQAAAKGLRFTAEPADSPLMLLGDPVRLRQALINYVGNALKFTSQGGVSLHCRILEETEADVLIRFEVEDSGIGIAPERQARLFASFEQGDASTTRKYGGTGLGLAITRRIAELMGGSVDLRSEEGRGSTFGLTVRLQRAKAQGDAASPASEATVASLREQFGGARVLLAEDNAISAEVALDFMRNAGLAVDHAANGEEAVALARAGDYDLALMDMQMPVMDGLQATRQIRELPQWRDRPILALTANVFAEDRQRCMEAGMNEALSKPLRPALFYAALLRWLPQRRGAAQAAAVEAHAAAAGSPHRDAAALEDFAMLPIVSRDRVLDFRERPAKYFRMLEMLIASLAPELRRLEPLLRSSDRESARAIIHSVRGAAVVLGAEGLRDSAARLEAAVHAGADAGVHDALTELGRSFDELSAAMGTMRQEP